MREGWKEEGTKGTDDGNGQGVREGRKIVGGRDQSEQVATEKGKLKGERMR